MSPVVRPFPRQPRAAGPLVWACILGTTCLLLFLFQKILWLVVPFILALIIYYALLPAVLRLVLAGYSVTAGASLVCFGAFLLLGGALDCRPCGELERVGRALSCRRRGLRSGESVLPGKQF